MKVDHHLINSEIARLDTLGKSKGLDVATSEAVHRLTACTTWLDRYYGTRRAYEVVQGAADSLIAHGRDVRVRCGQE